MSMYRTSCDCCNTDENKAEKVEALEVEIGALMKHVNRLKSRQKDHTPLTNEEIFLKMCLDGGEVIDAVLEMIRVEDGNQHVRGPHPQMTSYQKCLAEQYSHRVHPYTTRLEFLRAIDSVQIRINCGGNGYSNASSAFHITVLFKDTNASPAWKTTVGLWGQ